MRHLLFPMTIVLLTVIASQAYAEGYRLVHAIGNDEHIAAKDLTRAECEAQKRELKKVATALGTYDEATGHGSITCLPESIFED